MNREYVIEYKNKTAKIHNIKALDLDETLDCGQCFRFNKEDDGSYTGIVYDKLINVSMEKDTLILKGTSKKDVSFWVEYFDLNLDYEKIRRELSKKHRVLKEAALYCPGIRILNQDPFEALITFIISQNNNIKRIKGIVSKLCENFGEKIDDTHYSFPSATTLAKLNPQDLDIIKAGFRNKYIISGAQFVSDGIIDFDELRTIPYDKAQDKLMQIKGVGQKVADCVLLYGLHRLESFPLDVWMKRAMHVLFDDMDPKEFGKYGGIAQQYIFHYSRMHKELFE